MTGDQDLLAVAEISLRILSPRAFLTMTARALSARALFLAIARKLHGHEVEPGEVVGKVAQNGAG